MFPFHRVPRWSGLKCISQLFDDFCTKAVFQCLIVGKVLVNKVATHFGSKQLSPYFSILMEIVKINYMSKIYCCFFTLFVDTVIEVNYSWEFYFYIYKIEYIKFQRYLSFNLSLSPPFSPLSVCPFVCLCAPSVCMFTCLNF